MSLQRIKRAARFDNDLIGTSAKRQYQLKGAKMQRYIWTMLTVLVLALTITAIAQKKRNNRGQASRPNTITVSTKSMVRGVLENMTRAIEVYSNTRSLRGARQYIRTVEKDTDLLRKRIPESDPLMQHLRNARYSLVRAEAFFKAKVEPKTVSEEESFALVEMADDYNCPSDSSGNILMDSCIKIIMDEAKENQRQAFLAATNAGFYSP